MEADDSGPEQTRLICITGARDSGKTTWCRRHLLGPDTAGVVSLKVYGPGGDMNGYDAHRIEDGRRLPLLRIASDALPSVAAPPPGPAPFDRIGRFRVHLPAMQEVNRWIVEAWEGPKKNVVIDEIGRLELRGGGYAPALTRLFGVGLSRAADTPSGVRTGRTLFLVTREDFLRAVADRFGITPAETWIIQDGERISPRDV